MARFFVNIQLKVLVVVEEAAPLLVNCQMERVSLFQHVVVVSAGDLSLDLDALSSHFRSPDSNRIAPSI